MSRIAAEKLKVIDAERICIIKPSALGDVVQTLPVLRAIKARFPQSEVSWVINESLAPLLEDITAIDRCIPYQRRGGIGSQLKLLRELHSHRFDLVFDLQGLLRSGIMTAATRADYRVGLETAREGAALACNVILPGTDKDVPANRRYMEVASALGVDTDEVPQQADLEPNSFSQEWAAERLQAMPRPLIAVNPGARWLTKRWPVENFAKIAGNAIQQFNAGVVILGDDSETDICSRLDTLIRETSGATPSRCLNLCGKTDLKQLVAVLAAADCVVTNDSGPMHIAHAVGAPIVGVFLCTSAVRSGPPGDQHQLVSTAVDCAASYKKQCPQSAGRKLCCMQELAASRVWRALTIQMDKQLSRAA